MVEAPRKAHKRDADEGMKPWSPHDLRRTARTNMARVGVLDEVAEEVVNHIKPGVVGVYNKYATTGKNRKRSKNGKSFSLKF
jgi:integrase